MSDTFLFSSESVNEGHPGTRNYQIFYSKPIPNATSFSAHLDKICDQVSDAVLDACIREDPTSRVACGKLIVFHLSPWLVSHYNIAIT